MTIRFSPLVRDALDHGYPVVALETGIITHAMPQPLNLETSLAMEEQLTSAGVVPATIGMIRGDAVIGLSRAELTGLARDETASRIAIRDLAIAETRSLNGGVSMAATVHLAHRAGIAVCATTGLGGVHQNARAGTALQESSDLTALAVNPVVLVVSGVRPMLDVGATLERLETLSVPVLGYRTTKFPGYYVADSGFPVDHLVSRAAEIADIARARDEMCLRQALLIANPVNAELEVADYDQRLAEAAEIAARANQDDPEDTQVLLLSLEEATGGDAWRVGVEMYRRNVELAAEIAKQLATTPRYTD